MPSKVSRLHHSSNETGWEFYRCALDLRPDVFGPFSTIVDLWQSRGARSGGIPTRSDFDFLDFTGWHGRIFIAKLSNDPFNVTFSLWGTELVDWWEVDYTNKPLGWYSEEPSVWESTELDYFQKMQEAPFIGLSGGSLQQHGHPTRYVSAVDLPLSDGQNVSQVNAIHFLSRDQKLQQLFSDALPLAQKIHKN